MKNFIINLIVSIFTIVSTCSISYAQNSDATLINTRPYYSPQHMIKNTHAVDTGITIENGDIWIWGFRGSGQQGNGELSVSNTDKPARVEYFAQNGLSIIDAAAGIYHIIALDENGDVWGWGQNGYAEAGAKVCKGAYIITPCRILKGKDVIQVGAGEYVSYALTKSGQVYAWGHGIYGQVGNGELTSINGLYQIPQSHFNNKKVIMIGAAYEGGYAINSAGEIFGWGDEQNDSFGYQNKRTHIYVSTPKLLNLPINGNKIDYICGGEAYTAYSTSSGSVYGLGRLNMLGQGYDSRNDSSKTASPVNIINNVKMYYCRYAGSIAMTTDDKVYTWGSNLNKSDPFYVYGEVPTERKYYDKLTKMDGAKEGVYYWTNKGKGYGVGYGAAHKFSLTSVRNVDWKGTELTFVAEAMKEVYGQDYIIGQGF